MRILVFLGCLATASTAYAQPADPDATLGTPGAPAPPSTQPSRVPPAAPATPCAALPGCSEMPVAPPGMAPMARVAYPPPMEVYEMDSYRWQIALADVGAVSLLLAGKSSTTSSIAALSYLLTAPAIHGIHDQGGRVAASLGLRLLLPLVGGFGLAALAEHNSKCTPDDDDCDSGALYAGLFGFTLGAVSAMVIDAAVIARPVEIHRTVAPSWAPQISVTPERTTFGVVGRF